MYSRRVFDKQIRIARSQGWQSNNIARSSNGRTPPSGGGYLGSNPGLAALLDC